MREMLGEVCGEGGDGPGAGVVMVLVKKRERMIMMNMITTLMMGRNLAIRTLEGVSWWREDMLGGGGRGRDVA